MKIPEKLFLIEKEHLKEDKMFPFHLFIFNPSSEIHAIFLMANSPLTDEKEQFLDFIISKGGQISVDMKQVKTFLKAQSFKQEDIPSLKIKEKHPLEIDRETKLKALQDKREEEGPFMFVHELEKSLASDDYLNIISAARDEIAIFSVKKSHTVSLAIFLANKFLVKDSFINRIVAISFWLAKNCNIRDEKGLSDLVCASFTCHIGFTQLDSSLCHIPSIELNDDGKKRYRQHPGLAQHLILKSKVDISERAKHIVYQHHERWDGSGFPDNKKSEYIDILSLILGAVAHILEYSSGKIIGRSQSVIQTVRNLKNKTFTPGLEFEFGDTIYENLIHLINVDRKEEEEINEHRDAA